MDYRVAPIKSYSKKELCAIFGVGAPLMTKWIAQVKDVPAKRNGVYSPAQVKKIFIKHGRPEII